MPPPLFSLAMPTKNRSFLLHDTITAVLNQTFKDWELIIADNDDTDATNKVVEPFLSDSRIKYRRSGGLSMPDNWEFAASKAAGEYLCMLDDKTLLKSRALSRIALEITKEKHESITWRCDIFNDIESPPRLIFDLFVDGTVRKHSSDQILKMVIRGEYHNTENVILPLPQHSCIHRNLIERIRKSPMGRVFPPCSPDIQCVYLQLAYSEYSFQINETLSLIGSCLHSNGRSSVVNGKESRQFTKDLGGSENIYYDKMPIKAVSTTGGILNDFLHTKESIGGKLLRYDVDLIFYFISCYKQFISLPALGKSNSTQTKAWQSALAAQAPEVQASVNKEIEKMGPLLLLRFKSRIKFWRKVLGFKKLEFFIKRVLRLEKQKDKVFESPLEYITWEHAQFIATQHNNSSPPGGTVSKPQ